MSRSTFYTSHLVPEIHVRKNKKDLWYKVTNWPINLYIVHDALSWLPEDKLEFTTGFYYPMFGYIPKSDSFKRSPFCYIYPVAISKVIPSIPTETRFAAANLSV